MRLDEPPAAQPELRGPRLQIAIHLLDDGRVVFGDLPSDLAEVAQVLAGEQPGVGAAVRIEAELRSSEKMSEGAGWSGGRR